jgi:hypothetical protein
MKYECEIKIHGNINQVVDLFLDYKRMPEWQKGLSKIELMEGNWKENGAKVKLVFLMESYEMVMFETMELNESPHKVIQIYESGPVWNRCVSEFQEQDGIVVTYTMETEFKFKEVVETNSEMFRNQTQLGLQLFKEFVEANNL